MAKLSPFSHENVHATLPAPVINAPAAIPPSLREVTSLKVLGRKSCLSPVMARLAPVSKIIGTSALVA